MTWDRIAGYGFLTAALGTVIGAAAALASGKADHWFPLTIVGGMLGSAIGWYWCVFRRTRIGRAVPPRLAPQGRAR